MMVIKKLRNDLENYITKHNLSKKFNQSKSLFENNPFYPSLKTKLLEPKDRLIYAFRIDKKYRAIFIYIDKEMVEIIAITNHYK